MARRVAASLLVLLAATLVCHCERRSSTAGAGAAAVVADGPDAADEIRYLALGDSFTVGTGNAPEEAFPSRLAKRWREKGKHVTLKNLGVNGFTTGDVYAREVPEVKGFRPTLVTLAVGANDRVAGVSADAYRTRVSALLRAIVDAGVAPSRVVTLPQPDWSLSPAASAFGDRRALGADIEAFNRVLREETEKNGGTYVDIYPLMRRQADAKMLAADGLHPDARAHDEWAAALFDKLP